MKKINKMILLIVVTLLSHEASSESSNKEHIRLVSAIYALGNRPYFDPKTERIMYNHEEVPFLVTDLKRAQINARNNKIRNAEMRKSGNFSNLSEFVKEDEAYRKKDKSYIRMVDKFKSKNQDFEKDLKRISEKDQRQLQVQSEINEKLKKLDQRFSKVYKAEKKVVKLDSTTPDYTREDLAKLEKFKKEHKKLVTIQSEIDVLKNLVRKKTNSSSERKGDLLALNSKMKNHARSFQDELADYHKRLKVKTEYEFMMKQKKRRQVDAANTYAKEVMEDIEDADDFSEMIFRNYKTLNDDLEISSLKSEILLGRIDKRIRESVLGEYIQKQMEKTLAQALSDACSSAKMCAESSLINNNGRRLIEETINKSVDKLRQKGAPTKDR